MASEKVFDSVLVKNLAADIESKIGELARLREQAVEAQRFADHAEAELTSLRIEFTKAVGGQLVDMIKKETRFEAGP